jgi:NAD(P)-dependent dehydrogenase (short-subunit alcohol dehydrogenase family)
MDTQVVLITGGLTGIGRAAAVAFARRGAKVFVAGRRDEAGQALVEELRSFGSEAEFIKADVRMEDEALAQSSSSGSRMCQRGDVSFQVSTCARTSCSAPRMETPLAP